MKRFAASFGFILLTVLCSQGHAIPTRVEIAAAANANQNTTTSIDLVFMYDQSVATLLPMTGPEWFAHKDQLMGDIARRVDVVSLQIPPGTVPSAVTLPAHSPKARRVFAYVNFLDPRGQPVLDITSYTTVQITLDVDSVIYRNSN